MRIPARRPSPAMVVALIALFVALGGVGYAAATIGTNDIKNGAVTSKKIRNRTIRNFDVRRQTLTGSRIKESTLGPVPEANGLTFWGVFNANSVPTRSSGVTSSARLSTGRYQVGFGDPVAGCAYLATVGASAPATLPPLGQATVSLDPVLNNVVHVTTRNHLGAAANRPFHLAVTC
jgi:hypothetical protein